MTKNSNQGGPALNQQEVTFVYVIFELLSVSKIFAYFLVFAVNYCSVAKKKIGHLCNLTKADGMKS